MYQIVTSNKVLESPSVESTRHLKIKLEDKEKIRLKDKRLKDQNRR